MGRPKGESTGKERLIAAAGRSFRLGGYGGTGVDAVAREAGLTSGAFYAHFGSKAKAFESALRDGLDTLLAAVVQFRAERGAAWRDAFVDFYLGERLAAELGDACVLPTFTADVARTDEGAQAIYRDRLAAIAAAMAEGFDGDAARAWALLAILSGAAAMARAVGSDAGRAAIVESVRAAAKAV